jgi:hypothetical protein
MKPSNLILGISLLLAGGCHQHPLTDYRPLDQAGMGSSAIEQLKPFNISDPEIQQLVSLKHASISDETCVALISTARGHHHSFTSSESVGSLLGARYTESDILGFARADKLDVISGEEASPRSHQRRHDRRASRKGSKLARSHSQPCPHRFCARPRPQAAVALAGNSRGMVPTSSPADRFCLSLRH